MRHGHGRCVVVFRPIRASQSSKQTKVCQPHVIATVKCHPKGMYRRCHEDMFPHNVDASSSRIVPYLAGTCDCYLGAFQGSPLNCQKSLSFSSSTICITCISRETRVPHAYPFIHLPPFYGTRSSRYQDQAQWPFSQLFHFRQETQTPPRDTRRHSHATGEDEQSCLTA
jgi:hypothetical protein